MDSDNFEVTVINSSLKQFLGKIKKETTAELRADMDKKAIHIKAGNLEIYLAKLVG